MYCASEFTKILSISNPMLLGNLKMWNFVPEWHKGIFNIGGTQIAPKCTFFRPKLSLSNTQVSACHPVTKYYPGNIFFPNLTSIFVKCPGMTKFKKSFGVTIFIFLRLFGIWVVKIRVIGVIIKHIDHFFIYAACLLLALKDSLTVSKTAPFRSSEPPSSAFILPSCLDSHWSVGSLTWKTLWFYLSIRIKDDLMDLCR